MKAEQLTPQRWEDIVFEYRNKEYGAYENRVKYSRHVLLAAIITLVTAALALAYPRIVALFESQNEEVIPVLKTVKYTDLAPPPPIQNTPPPPQVNIPPPVKTIIKYLPPKVTDKEIPEEEEMPTIEEIKVNEVGSENIEGDATDVVFDEPVKEVVADTGGDDDKIFTVVEQQAEYPGGMAEMMKFLQKNVKYPAAARRMGIEGSVFVSFVVDKEGKISDPQIVKGISADCDKEAMRVVQLMPPWKPGKQNGRSVKSRFVLPIKFKLAT